MNQSINLIDTYLVGKKMLYYFLFNTHYLHSGNTNYGRLPKTCVDLSLACLVETGTTVCTQYRYSRNWPLACQPT
jgi:hypothetical protein